MDCGIGVFGWVGLGWMDEQGDDFVNRLSAHPTRCEHPHEHACVCASADALGSSEMSFVDPSDSLLVSYWMEK